MLTIPGDTFRHTSKLQYLDMSFTNVFDFGYQIPLPTLEAIINLVYGVKIQTNVFKYLPDLVYLDLSHTKLTRNSAMAFTHLGEKLKYLSLCYTSMPMVGNALFKNTALIGLDLSGNPTAAYTIIDDAFEGIADTLQFLYFEHSNIKDLTWLHCLGNLRVLGLAGNNINSISLDTFSALRSLQMLDLSSNHIGNWYNRAFTKNENLRVLNLRENNINIITSEMLKDFQLLEYLSLGENNFVCDCLLQELVDIAAANNKEAECSNSVLQDAQERWGDKLNLNISSIVGLQQLPSRLLGNDSFVPVLSLSKMFMSRYNKGLRQSYLNMKPHTKNHFETHPKMRFMAHSFFRAVNAAVSPSTQCPDSEPVIIHDKLNSSKLKFQLLDYEDERYWCFNETERMQFMQLQCAARIYVDDIAQTLHTFNKYIIGIVCSLLALIILGTIIYFKRWHIRYYYSSIKSAALVSEASKEIVDKFNIMNEQDPNLVYDIFISYCQNDRQWVLDELLPNCEEAGDVSICMHERDFQVSNM